MNSEIEHIRQVDLGWKVGSIESGQLFDPSKLPVTYFVI